MCDLTIDEAIKHCKEVAVESVECESCCSQHSQLANWLEELKAFRGMSKKDKVQDLSDSLNYLDCAKCELKAGCMALESAFNVSLCDSVNKVADYYKKNHEEDKPLLHPGNSLIAESFYYIADGKVVKAKDFDVNTVTLKDLQKARIIQPENRVVIKDGKELCCYFPNTLHSKIEHILDTVSVPRGYNYTLHTCDTLYSDTYSTSNILKAYNVDMEDK